MNSITAQIYQSAEPSIGMGATELLHSGRHAYTVIGITPNKTFAVIQQDKAVRADSNGMSDAQSYDYQRDPEGRVEIIKRCKDGHWRIFNGTGSSNGNVVMIGRRDERYDYSY